MYGTTTGFGGSATTRISTAVDKLQRVLIHGLQAGILPISYHQASSNSERELDLTDFQIFDTLGAANLVMPESWVKGAIVIRMNTLIRGHSGCRLDVIEAMHKLLVENITPCPPLRQSISASGDLGPLAYIAGALTGDNACLVWDGEGHERRLTTAPIALSRHSIQGLPLWPKEGLSIVNGTAPSCSASAMALHDAHFLLLLSQATTAMCLEALLGSAVSFDSFLSDVARPHPGQIEVSANIRRALSDSKLVHDQDENDLAERLKQDRYCLRTAPQWLGPQVEELISAHRTLLIEINSTTDNPIIDVSRGKDGNLSGGNFQGTSLTVAMEKVRIGLQHVGRMGYAQFVELGSPAMNRGLAPDLAANEPSFDYGQKALDMATASYLAELSFVSNTVSNHVQAAEMHNQSVNSLALVSARYTATAVQLTQMILSNLLLSACQALDLRSMYANFFELMESKIGDVLSSTIQPALSSADAKALRNVLYQRAKASFRDTSTMDSHDRFHATCRPLVADVFTFLNGRQHANGSGTLLEHHTFNAPDFHQTLGSSLSTVWVENREVYFEGGTAEHLLGSGTKWLYNWVRKDLGIAMRKGIDIDANTVDVDASKIYNGVVRGDVNSVLLNVFL